MEGNSHPTPPPSPKGTINVPSDNREISLIYSLLISKRTDPEYCIIGEKPRTFID